MIHNDISKAEMKNEVEDALRKIDDFDKKLNLKKPKDNEIISSEKEFNKYEKEDLNKTEMFLDDKLSATSFFKKVNSQLNK